MGCSDRESPPHAPREYVNVLSVSFSPDGATLASGSLDGIIRLWDVATGRLLRTLQGNTYGADSVSFSPDGTTLASGGGFDRIVRLWDVATGSPLRTLEGHTGEVRSVSFSPDGTALASGSFDRIVRLWDVATGNPLHALQGHTRWGFVNSVSFSSDGTTLASGSRDKTVRLWDVATGSPLRILEGHTDDVRSVSFSPDSVTLASGGFDRTVRLWDVATGSPLRTLEGHTGDVHSVSFSPDGTTLASGSSDGTVLLWALIPPEPVPTEPAHRTEDVNDDGIINNVDLALVALNMGQTGEIPADVNGDKIVNIEDLLLVAGALGYTAAAPSARGHNLAFAPTRAAVELWLDQARQVNLTDPALQRGLLVLERLLAALTPKETALLANYPNPFNPETWIPYQLAVPAEVAVSIYTVEGQLVRQLDFGYQAVGVYAARSRAAYWDGRNAVGEPLASGVYFYRLTAGDFTATRKMLIRK